MWWTEPTYNILWFRFTLICSTIEHVLLLTQRASVDISIQGICLTLLSPKRLSHSDINTPTVESTTLGDSSVVGAG